MKKICAIVVSLVAAAIIGCYEYVETECYSSEMEGYFKYVTKSKFDSVHVYLGAQRICDAKTGGYYIGVMCKTSEDSDYDVFYDDGDLSKQDVAKLDSCIDTEESPEWYVFTCFYHGVFDTIDMSVSNLTIETFYDKISEKYIFENFTPGGFSNVFIPVVDTMTFLNEATTPQRVWLDESRAGCSGGLCLVRDRFPKEEFCYEKK